MFEIGTENKNKKSVDEELVKRVSAARKKLLKEISNYIAGQKEVIDELLTALLANGHALIVGVPGLAKTTLVKTLAKALKLDFGRVQFTPDLMPTDITGTEIIDDTASGKREFRFIKGPVFCNLLLADEINRTPPRTQAALLEAMQECCVTIGGKTYELDPPFMVFATQNPIEQSGVYPLPEAQLDRFMLQINLDYPSSEEELKIINMTTAGQEPSIEPVLEKSEILHLQKLSPSVPIAKHLMEYVVRLVRASRPLSGDASPDVCQYISWGAGPRAAQMLVLSAKARTLMNGRFVVSMDDIKSLVFPVLRHRLILSFEAMSQGITVDDIIAKIVKTVPVK